MKKITLIRLIALGTAVGVAASLLPKKKTNRIVNIKKNLREEETPKFI